MLTWRFVFPNVKSRASVEQSTLSGFRSGFRSASDKPNATVVNNSVSSILNVKKSE